MHRYAINPPKLRNPCQNHRKPLRSLSVRAVPPRQSNVQPFLLPPRAPDQHAKDGAWLGRIVTTYFDNEWTPLDVHRRLGDRISSTYVSLRSRGVDDMSDFLIALYQDLNSFDFYESFTDAFEVSNKVVEMLMMRYDCDVCCQNEKEREVLYRLTRFDEEN